MAAANIGDFTATTTWTNIVSTYPAAASVALSIQNNGDNPVFIVWGGAQPTDEDTGQWLYPTFSTVTDGAAAVWIKAATGTETVNILAI